MGGVYAEWIDAGAVAPVDSVRWGGMASADELVTPRVVLVLGLVAVPAAGPLSWSMPQQFDPFGPRLVIAALSAVGLWWGARSAWWRQHLREYAFAVTTLCFAWFQYAAYRNQQSVDDVLGLLVISFAMSLLVSSRIQLGITTVLGAAGFVLVSTLLGAPRFPLPITLLLFVGLHGSLGASTLARRSLSRRLARANAELEERVSRRTRSLHDHMVRLEQEVNQRRLAEERADTANRAKTAFLATMSHELRTPLNAVLGYADLIREDLVDADMPDTVEDVAQLTHAARRLLDLIDQLLVLTQAEQGESAADLQPVPVADLVKRCVDDVAASSRHGNRFRWSADESVLVVADPAWLERVLLNLVANADKFTEAGDITVSVLPTSEEVLIAVQDTGVGLPDGATDFIFDRFTQVDGSCTRRRDGAGVGLPVCKELLDGMRGWVEVESSLGEGSTFRIGLPRAPQSVPSVAQHGLRELQIAVPLAPGSG